AYIPLHALAAPSHSPSSLARLYLASIRRPPRPPLFPYTTLFRSGAGGRASGRDRPAAPPRRGLRAWPARPTWTLREAEERCGVSRSTLKRRLAAGDFPNAYKTSQGQWRVPVNDLIAAGYQPDAVDWGEEQEEPAPATTPPDRVTELEHELAQE